MGLTPLGSEMEYVDRHQSKEGPSPEPLDTNLSGDNHLGHKAPNHDDSMEAHRRITVHVDVVTVVGGCAHHPERARYVDDEHDALDCRDVHGQKKGV